MVTEASIIIELLSLGQLNQDISSIAHGVVRHATSCFLLPLTLPHFVSRERQLFRAIELQYVSDDFKKAKKSKKRHTTTAVMHDGHQGKRYAIG